MFASSLLMVEREHSHLMPWIVMQKSAEIINKQSLYRKKRGGVLINVCRECTNLEGKVPMLNACLKNGKKKLNSEVSVGKGGA